jgi:hypothetical protein
MITMALKQSAETNRNALRDKAWLSLAARKQAGTGRYA